MERCGTGLVTVFEGLLNKAYYSPDGHHVDGGGSTVYAYSGTDSIQLMIAYRGRVANVLLQQENLSKQFGLQSRFAGSQRLWKHRQSQRTARLHR